MNTHNLLYSFLASLLLSVSLTPLVRFFAERKGLVAKPKEDRWHKKPTALLGGIAIFASFIIVFSIFNKPTTEYWQLLSVFSLIFLLGLFDDILGLQPYTKLAGQIIIGCMFVYYGFYINTMSPLLGLPLTILWLVGIMNAFNLLDNMDGLSAGVAFISAVFLCIHAIYTVSYSVALIAAIVAGASAGFLFYNFNPAKIFMGDCGSQFLGFVLAASAVLGTSRYASNLLITLSIPVIVLAVPIFDTVFVTFMRKINARSIVQGGKDHTSHRLVALGLSEKKAVLVLYTISVVSGLLVLFNNRLNIFALFTLAASFAIILFFFGLFLGEVKIYSEEEVEKAKAKMDNNNNVFLNGLILHKRRIAEVAVDFLLICISYIAAYLLRFEGMITEGNAELILKSLPIIIAIKLFTFFYFGLYRGVWRYASLQDVMAIFKAVSIGSILSVVTLVYLFRFEGYSRTAFIIDWMLLFVLVSGARTTLRMLREIFASLPKENSRKVLIVGANDVGELLLREIKSNNVLNYLPVGFLDDDSKKLGKKIHGLPVLGTGEEIVKIAKQKGVQEVLVALPYVNQKRLWEVFEDCKKNNIAVKHTFSFTQTLLEEEMKENSKKENTGLLKEV